jgi:hypothetical protein
VTKALEIPSAEQNLNYQSAFSNGNCLYLIESAPKLFLTKRNELRKLVHHNNLEEEKGLWKLGRTLAKGLDFER